MKNKVGETPGMMDSQWMSKWVPCTRVELGVATRLSQIVEAWKKGRVCRRVISRGVAGDSTDRDAAVVRQLGSRA